MRICLIARNSFHNDRKARSIHHVLKEVGHEVLVISIDHGAATEPVSAAVSPRAGGVGQFGRAVYRLTPARLEEWLTAQRLAAAAAATHSDIYLPLHEAVLDVAISAARRSGGAVLRTPQMGSAAPFDLIDLAPGQPELAVAASGNGAAFTPADQTVAYQPGEGRHLGSNAVICYRKTAANPGRYLESALARAGFEVRLETEAIDLDTVDTSAAFVLFVESPYPAIEVHGSTKVPTLFWAHHGEHHLSANIRLADRYRADAVLLAHSWHLAPWFPAPVHRFPFAVAPELFSPPIPLTERRYDVAMVGSELGGDAWQYRKRGQLVEDLRSALPGDRLGLVEGVAPEEMAQLYGQSRIVVNEGGVRHFPITMRVFEAVGAGAVLLTEPIPATDVLFDRGEYAVLSDDVIDDVSRILGDLEASQQMADSAVEHARGRHTYDHRVDQLVEISSVTAKRERGSPAVVGAMARLVDDDVEVQRVVQVSHDGLAAELPDREVWSAAERAGRLPPGSMDAVAVASVDALEIEPVLQSARRYIYVDEDVTGLDDYLASHRPEASIESHGRLRRVDLMAASYRARPTGSAR